jgi:hypothetical protein
MEKLAGGFARRRRRPEAVAVRNGVRVSRRKKPAEYQLPLKNTGEQIEVIEARLWENKIRKLLEQDPGHFQALVSLVEGRPDEVSKEQVRDLRKWLFLARDGSPLPGAKAIIQAAYRKTPDGPAVVDPLDVRTAEEIETFLRAEKQLKKREERGLDRIIRKLSGEDKENNEGHRR